MVRRYPSVTLAWMRIKSAAAGSVLVAGGVRAQFSDEVNINLGARSLGAFAAFGSRPGWEIDLHRVGATSTWSGNRWST